MSNKIFGIKNCDTMKKTFQLFEGEGMEYEFIDYKKNVPSEALLRDFSDNLGLDTIINKRGTTYKKLTPEEKAALDEVTSAIPLLREKSSMIKRPIIQFRDGTLLAGLDKDVILTKK